MNSEDLYIVHKEEFSTSCYMCDTDTWQRLSIFIRDSPIFSSERMLHEDYDSKVVISRGLAPNRQP
jgi:hypothetical protein